jgi:hypothetical protein
MHIAVGRQIQVVDCFELIYASEDISNKSKFLILDIVNSMG